MRYIFNPLVILPVSLGGLLYAFEAFQGSTAINILEWALYAHCLLLILAAISVIVSSHLFFSRTLPSRQDLKARLLQGSRNSSRFIASGCAVVGGLLIVTSTLTGLHWWPVALWCFAGAFFVSSRYTQPPLVLVLGTSRPSTRKLYSRLRFVAMPHAAANLLETDSEAEWLPSFSRADTFRTTDPSWLQVVAALAEIARIIVVDIRDATSAAVEQEIQLLLNAGLPYKTLFVTNGSSLRGFALRPVSDAAKDCIAIVTEDEAVGLLRYVARSPAKAPTPQQPLPELATRLRTTGNHL
jgi:hypothetical protein